MPLFKSRFNRPRPATPGAPCTTSCEKKPCSCCSPPMKIHCSSLQPECPTRNCCCKKLAAVPNCKTQNCCCRKLASILNCELRSRCCLVKDCTGKASNPEQTRPRGSSSQQVVLNRCSCNAPKTSRSLDNGSKQAMTCQAKAHTQLAKCKATSMKFQERLSCGRPGCSTRKPCITCCKRTWGSFNK